MFLGRFSFFYRTGILKLPPAANVILFLLKKKQTNIPRRFFGTVRDTKKCSLRLKIIDNKFVSFFWDFNWGTFCRSKASGAFPRITTVEKRVFYG